MRLRDTGTRIRGVTVAGDYGNPSSIDWTEATLNKVDYVCEFQPESSTEDVVQGERVESTWRLFLPAGADMTAKDRFRFAGVDYEVNGDVEHFRVRGAEHHCEARLLKVTGG
jgi:hypothetical protein